jgi:hypothetical protein
LPHVTHYIHMVTVKRVSSYFITQIISKSADVWACLILHVVWICQYFSCRPTLFIMIHLFIQTCLNTDHRKYLIIWHDYGTGCVAIKWWLAQRNTSVAYDEGSKEKTRNIYQTIIRSHTHTLTYTHSLTHTHTHTHSHTHTHTFRYTHTPTHTKLTLIHAHKHSHTHTHTHTSRTHLTHTLSVQHNFKTRCCYCCWHTNPITYIHCLSAHFP